MSIRNLTASVQEKSRDETFPDQGGNFLGQALLPQRPADASAQGQAVPALAWRPHAASITCSLLARPCRNSFLANGPCKEKKPKHKPQAERGPQAEVF